MVQFFFFVVSFQIYMEISTWSGLWPTHDKTKQKKWPKFIIKLSTLMMHGHVSFTQIYLLFILFTVPYYRPCDNIIIYSLSRKVHIHVDRKTREIWSYSRPSRTWKGPQAQPKNWWWGCTMMKVMVETFSKENSCQRTMDWWNRPMNHGN